MATVQYTAKVKEGLLLELPQEAQELHLKPGDQVQVQLDRTGAEARQGVPNEGMLAALREIAARQHGRRHTDGSETDRMLREGRTGAMWGDESTE
jgi:hypothetical protein